MNTRIIYASAASLLLSTTSAFAQQAPDTVATDRDQIVVTAGRTAEPLSRVGQSITVIDAQEIARRQTDTVADLLRTTPGVSISRNGPIGASTAVLIRGAESDQTAALINGVKLNDPSSPGGGFNFGNLLIGNIERIEVLRGPSSVLWGSQAIGGVVNMITAQPTEVLTVNARGEYGYRNTAQGVANVSGKVGPLSFSGGGGYFRTDGISAFSEARGGKEKDGYTNYGANLDLRLALTDAISVDARGYYSDGKVGIDGFPAPTYAFGDTKETSKSREFVGYTGLNVALFDGRLRNRVGYAYTDTKRRNFDPDSVPTETFAGNGRNERLEYQGVADILDQVQATFGAERETSHFTTSSYGGPQTRGRAQIDSFYGQLAVTPVSGLTVTGGVRRDDHNQFGGQTSFAASGVFSPNGGSTTFRASYSEGFKAPTLYQLQSEYGNARLRPERAKGWDAGITQRALDGAVEASATYFRRNATDLINFVSCAAPLTGICTGRPSGTYDNVAKARSEGVELTLALRPVDALRFAANYTYTDATNRSEGTANYGKKLIRRPDQTINASVDYRLPFGLTTGATVTSIGSSYDTANNSRKVQGYVLTDIRAALPVREGVEVYGRIENLFDERYETIYRYGSMGRAAYIGVRLRYQ
ncbi:TonB-dependent receptor plug domain-containing protein [Sphingomonas sp. CJ20]